MRNLVTVIIPVYNRQSYIIECLESVLQQTYRPIEVIVVDDGSTDNSISLINEFIVKNNIPGVFEIKLLIQENSGAPRARNYGYEQSKGKYIQWLDSDDLLLSNKIASQIKVFSEEIDVVYSRAQFFNEVPTNLLDKYWGRIPEGNSSDYFEFPWQTMCALYKKVALQKFGVWKEDLSLSDDWELALRYKIKANVKFLNDVSSLYRDHNGDRVGNNWSIEKVNSLSSILINTYTLSDENNLIDSYLIKRYQNRLTFCVIQYGALNGKKERKQLISLVNSKNLGSPIIKVLSFFSGLYVNRILLKAYSLLK
ncbi:glycosyltransferase family 2 protein [Winogradskyella litoriviva]|uniref:Glycosyltransferase family 2 protein n=1 Tax=Winogradskyella litoriviva TaxID=1220182 RepID=A0ABX2E412_9FLAO|nr:glycosyltransferase family A protein [Winogradskyella litoriviva]NRD23233.1 glycosyltransferase family 2 protein [Winogradskyella litoriviva]